MILCYISKSQKLIYVNAPSTLKPLQKGFTKTVLSRYELETYKKENWKIIELRRK